MRGVGWKLADARCEGSKLRGGKRSTMPRTLPHSAYHQYVLYIQIASDDCFALSTSA